MRKLSCILSLFIVNCALSMAQTPEVNLQKYWTYRDRLLNYFIALSPNDEQGTNFPALRFDSNTMHIGDGNSSLPYYIGMLATEYKLLQYYGQDVNETRTLLLWALKAVQRIDRTAEKYFRNEDTPREEDYNGFFIRDDVDNSILNNSTLKKNLSADVQVSSRFTQEIPKLRVGGIDAINDFEESKDCVWNYLLNLELVHELVDDIELKDKAKEIAYKMVRWMHNSDGWFIKNPAAGFKVVDEDKGRGVINEYAPIPGFSYAFAEAAGTITKRDLHYNGSSLLGGIFKRSMYESESIGTASTYGFKALSTIIGFHDLDGRDGYDYMRHKSYMSNDNQRFIHFPLIYAVLHEWKEKEFYIEAPKEFARYEDILNKANMCGNHYLVKDGQIDQTLPWISDNYITTPVRASFVYGYFNGIDYMLLHNLFWLAYLTDIKEHYEDTWTHSNCTIKSGEYDNNEDWHDHIYSCDIKSGGKARILAGKQITLKNGFHAEYGSLFSAKPLHFSNNTYPVYKRTEICKGCSFPFANTQTKSGKIENEIVDENLKFQNQSFLSSTKIEQPEPAGLNFQVFPNPSSGNFSLKINGYDEKSDVKVSVSNTLAIEVYKASYNSGSIQINLLGKAKGVYILTVEVGASRWQEKLVVR